MAKFKVLKTFRDVHTNEIYKVGSDIEMTVKRANEVEKNLDSSFLVRIQEILKSKE
ncbi:hypothetical protein [Bacillus sp. AFS002410]|uniref:hypothetical protein n=1 Tax=Bacillus sp. AFS002410 TaxID=2033481 RepID=UPI0015CF7C86|nr:hypothetical protein [Bacillus sp. AFS002410]